MKNNSVAERLRVIRADQKLKQTDMADLLKISYPSLVAYENEKTEPNFRTLEHLYNLGYNLNWLVGGQGPIKNDRNQSTSNIDINLLENLMVICDKLISQNKLTIEKGKLAKVITMAYQEGFSTGIIDESKVLSLLQLVAL